MTNKSGRKRQRTNNLGHELIRGLTQVTKVWCIIAPLERTVTDIFKEKRKCCNHRCPDSGLANQKLCYIPLQLLIG